MRISFPVISLANPGTLLTITRAIPDCFAFLRSYRWALGFTFSSRSSATRVSQHRHPWEPHKTAQQPFRSLNTLSSTSTSARPWPKLNSSAANRRQAIGYN
ncbi:hypothetical protein BDW68DRAFT_160198 [Aspergillus falconensis]